MKNKNRVFETTKLYMYDWKPETTLTILELIKYESSINKEETNKIINKLKVLSSIIK